MRPKKSAWRWFEEYGCGCVSPGERVKRELPGYCPTHGADRRNVYRENDTTAVQVSRNVPGGSLGPDASP